MKPQPISLGLSSDSVYHELCENQKLYLSEIDQVIDPLKYELKKAKNSEYRNKCSYLLSFYKDRYKKVQRGLSLIMHAKENKDLITGWEINEHEFRVEGIPYTTYSGINYYIINRDVNKLINDVWSNYSLLLKQRHAVSQRTFEKIILIK